MKLHYHPVSPYARKALVAVYHRADPVELRFVDLRTGGHRTPEFAAISPFGKLPVLETPEGPLPESTSIIEYLEDRGPRSLLPLGHERIARHFDRLGDHYLIDPMSDLLFHPDLAHDAPDTVHKAWMLFAHQLADGRPFVCGPTFSLGDLGAAIATEYLVRLGLQPPPALGAWLDRCFAVPAMARALAEAVPMLMSRLVPAK